MRFMLVALLIGLCGALHPGHAVAGPNWPTGLVLHVDYTLRPGRSDLELSLAVVNPTDSEVSYQLWVNAMLAPGGGEDTLPDTEFLYATDQMIVHGGDPWIGQPREVIPWPVHKGYDLSRYSAWLERIDGAGLFVKDAQLRPGHVGAYVPSEDEGIAMAFDPTLARGVQLWCFGRLHRRDPPSCVDSPVCAGYKVPSQFDSMIGKLIVHRPTREEAICTMRRALYEYVVEGISTTIPLQLRILNHSRFRRGKVDTAFIEDYILNR